jgi:hypothetical protein
MLIGIMLSLDPENKFHIQERDPLGCEELASAENVFETKALALTSSNGKYEGCGNPMTKFANQFQTYTENLFETTRQTSSKAQNTWLSVVFLQALQRRLHTSFRHG